MARKITTKNSTDLTLPHRRRRRRKQPRKTLNDNISANDASLSESSIGTLHTESPRTEFPKSITPPPSTPLNSPPRSIIPESITDGTFAATCNMVTPSVRECDNDQSSGTEDDGLSISDTVTLEHHRQRKQVQQVYLDYGQSNFGENTICDVCGMLSVHGLDEDSSNHAKICREIKEGVSFPGWKRERIVKSIRGDHIVEVRGSDPIGHRNKVTQIKRIVDKEMGFIPNTNEYAMNKTAFLYISNKKVVGFCTAEVISRAYLTSGNSSRRIDAQKAMLGIHQIWCHGMHRKKGIGTMLVNAAREKMMFGLFVPLKYVAFSSPTGDGIKFAKIYLGVKDILVYDC